MYDITYSAALVPVRDAFAAAHTRFWKRLASPGAWWTGSERVAIAAEVRHARHCTLCQARKAAITPAAIAGHHDHLGALPEVAVDVIHRVVTDPGRLSHTWFQETMAAGLSAEQYVELLGTLVAMVSIDSFCRGIGVPLHPLPTPQPGAPSQYRPPGAVQEDAWVPMIPVDRATGAEADLYGGQAVGNVIRAMSLVPDEVRTLCDLSAVHYLPMGQVRDPSAAAGALNRMQMELIAGRISALRQCFYWTSAHAYLLRASSQYHGTATNLAAVTDPEVAASSGVEHGSRLLAFAEAMVGEDEDALTHVRHAVIEVLSPAAMVDAAGVASNFERMVRIADATGIPLDARMQALSQEVRDALQLERFTVHKETELEGGKPRPGV